jgi:hypothetical protein
MRWSEQFTLEWPQVDFSLHMIHLEKAKNGSDRHIPMNSSALASFERLKVGAPEGTESVILTSRNGEDSCGIGQSIAHVSSRKKTTRKKAT